MSPEDQTPERLSAAIDALIRGTPIDEACAGLPAELHPLVAAGARLAALRPASPDGPRPAFVLALEEQLRADLRLARTGPPTDPPADPSADPLTSPPIAAPKQPARSRLRTWGGRGIVACLLLFSLVAFWQAEEAAGPYDALYPAKRAIESLRMLFAFSAADKAETSLDLGWRRLEEASQVIERGEADDLVDMVEDMTTAYTLALTYAEQSDDRRIGYLAQTETRMAVDELARLAAGADPSEAAVLGRVNLVLSDTGQGRRIVAITAPSAAAVAVLPGIGAVPLTSATPGLPPADTPEPTGVATAETLPPPPASPTAPPLPSEAPTTLPPATTAPASTTPEPSPWPTPTALPPTEAAPPPTSTRVRPKPPPPDTPTPTAPPPTAEPPSRTPKPWATETAPPTSSPAPPRPSETPDPGVPPPSAEPPAPGPGLP